MTTLYYVQQKAEELKTGNMFCSWAVFEDGLYPEASQIMNIKESPRKKKLNVILADGRDLELKPEMLVVIQDYA